MFERAGILVGDRFTKLIEWSPCAPVGRPGLKVNRKFETSLLGLYACGEAASPQAVVTGLAAAATSGAKAGKSAAEFARAANIIHADSGQIAELREYTFSPLQRKDGIEPDHILLSLQESIIPYDVLLLRDGGRMEKALGEIEDVRDNQMPLLGAYDPHYLRMAHECQNLLLVAEMHLKTAILRMESRVALREDFPYTDNMNWLKWIEIY